MKALLIIVFLFSVTAVFAVEQPLLLEPAAMESADLNQLDSQIQEDAVAIEKMMTILLIKAQEKSDHKILIKWPSLKKPFEAGSLKLAKSKAWMLGLNKKIFAQYPELVVMDPVLRLIRSVTLFPIMISSGYAELIPLALAVPDVEILDAAYFGVRDWIKKRKFASQYGIQQSELDQYKIELLSRTTLSQSEIEKMISDPVILKNLLNSTSTKSDYQNLLNFWNDKTIFSNVQADLSGEIKLLIAVENLILRLQIEGAFYEVGFPFQDMTDKAALKDWFVLFNSRREIYKATAELKNFQYQYLSALYKDESVDQFVEDFTLFRGQSLTLLSTYRMQSEKFSAAYAAKVLMCKELFP